MDANFGELGRDGFQPQMDGIDADKGRFSRRANQLDACGLRDLPIRFILSILLDPEPSSSVLDLRASCSSAVDSLSEKPRRDFSPPLFWPNPIRVDPRPFAVLISKGGSPIQAGKQVAAAAG
ncbi:hypothetical protein OKA05_06330 [Luteolibacter arcticus]|uniref:Uncharacterized protein n=1 Tax=Luteolibacter arcticus TaxID=1581411 RepID=A0ABT3GFC7_9BACT|nr:hypothetical protein [Luteolibacter arcticus]MCW1922161.1 hypothetical protein [Luteolibacter arcticus]